MAIALLALEADERVAAARKQAEQAKTPPKWRRMHSKLSRAADKVAAVEARRSNR